jgi:hypothetical protein
MRKHLVIFFTGLALICCVPAIGCGGGGSEASKPDEFVKPPAKEPPLNNANENPTPVIP